MSDKKIKLKIDLAKETRRAARQVIGNPNRSGSGAHKEHRRRIDAEDAEREMEAGIRDEESE